MDETKPTSAPASPSRGRLAGLIRSAIRAEGPFWPFFAVCALLVLPMVPSIVRGEVAQREIIALALVVGLGFLLLFVVLVVPNVLMERFGFYEWSRRRGKKVVVDLRSFLAGVGRILRPAVRLFSWWLPLRLGRFGEAVLLPDPMAILGAVVVLAWLSASVAPLSFFWLYLPLLGPALLVSPFALTAVLWVSRKEVRVVRFFVVIPYWVHRVPHQAEFAEFWALEDPAPSGVAFTSRSRTGYELHLGTTPSAAGLYHHIAAVLERAGWTGAPPGHLPRMSRIPRS
jgi:hypothetical protein